VDVERTIEFNLEAQAKSEPHLLALDQRADSLATLVQQGMQLVVNFQNEANQKFNALIDAQLRTEPSGIYRVPPAWPHPPLGRHRVFTSLV
jgi:hypothetical protein